MIFFLFLNLLAGIERLVETKINVKEAKLLINQGSTKEHIWKIIATIQKKSPNP